MPVTPATPAEVEQILSTLAETPACIAAAVSGRAEAALAHSPDPKTWSVNENLAHLRGCCDVWGKTIRAMLVQDRPVLPHVSPRGWAKRKGYARLRFDASFQVFERERGELLELLRGIPFESWDRPAMIEGRVHTIFSQAQRLAGHEALHCAQIEALLIKL